MRIYTTASMWTPGGELRASSTTTVAFNTRHQMLLSAETNMVFGIQLACERSGVADGSLLYALLWGEDGLYMAFAGSLVDAKLLA